MISLIINADDLGCNAERDRGIFKAFTDGIVTSASLLANGPSFDSAARLARRPGCRSACTSTLPTERL